MPSKCSEIAEWRVHCCVRVSQHLGRDLGRVLPLSKRGAHYFHHHVPERYHLAMGREESWYPPLEDPCRPLLRLPQQPQATPPTVYLCGEELSGGTEYQLHVNPPGVVGRENPFFPFLNCPPSRSPCPPCWCHGPCVCLCTVLSWPAGPVDPTWESGSQSGPSSSPWARQYNCNTFICFFCRKEKKRPLGLKAVCVDRLPVFLYAPRVSQTLVIDNGKQLTIGSCVDVSPWCWLGRTWSRLVESHKTR